MQSEIRKNKGVCVSKRYKMPISPTWNAYISPPLILIGPDGLIPKRLFRSFWDAYDFISQTETSRVSLRFSIDQRMLLKTSSIYNIQYVDAGSSLRCSPCPSVITACLIRRKIIRNCSEMFGNDQVSEMFVPYTAFWIPNMFAQDAFYRTFFIYLLVLL